MLGLTAAHLPEYRQFVERHASLGYARLFAVTGDFVQAQAELEGALVRGMRIWFWRSARGQDSADTLDAILQREVPAPEPQPGDEGESPFSFSRASKLRQVEEAAGILRSFSGDDLAALFLEHVEELPRDRIGLLLQKPASYLDQLGARLAKKVEGWRAGDGAPMDVFRRALAQHKLSPAFPSAVIGQVKLTGGWGVMPGPTGSRVARALLCIGVAIAVVTVGHRSGANYADRIRFSGVTWLVFLDVLLLAVAWTFRRGVAAHEGGRLAARLGLGGRLLAMRVLDHVGLTVTTVGLLVLAGHDVLARAPGLAALLVLARLVWWAGAAVLGTQVAVRAFLDPLTRKPS